jgi:cobyrinic acid a,c-diamide synthase
MMYLCRSLANHSGQRYPMVDFFPQEATMTSRLQNFGYATVTFKHETVLGPAGLQIRAHEFHHSQLDGAEPDYALTVQKSLTRSWPGGLSRNNVLAAYPHLHFYANPLVAANFVARCRQPEAPVKT